MNKDAYICDRSTWQVLFTATLFCYQPPPSFRETDRVAFTAVSQEIIYRFAPALSWKESLPRQSLFPPLGKMFLEVRVGRGSICSTCSILAIGYRYIAYTNSDYFHLWWAPYELHRCKRKLLIWVLHRPASAGLLALHICQPVPLTCRLYRPRTAKGSG